jgi:DNA-binding NarL/FixJ family response regulator
MYNFTPKEKEILELIKNEGLNVKEIAERLYINICTTKKYLHNIYRKTGVNDRAKLLLFLLKNPSIEDSK